MENPLLNSQQKAFIVASQEYMWKDPENNTGVIKLDSKRFAAAIGISTSTLRRREKELQQMNILSIKPSKQTELMVADNGDIIPTSGMPIQYRVFHFDKFCNLLALKFNQVDTRIDSVEDRIAQLERQNQELQDQIQLLLESKQSNNAIIL